MRLIFKKYDSEFNPVVAGVGVLALVGGVYGMALCRDILERPIALAIALLPALTAIICGLIVFREIQEYERGPDSVC